MTDVRRDGAGVGGRLVGCALDEHAAVGDGYSNAHWYTRIAAYDQMDERGRPVLLARRSGLRVHGHGSIAEGASRPCTTIGGALAAAWRVESLE